MALVYRGGRPYSYKSVRRGGRVTSEYRGSGEVAFLFERMEDLIKDREETERSKINHKREKLEASDRALTEYVEHVEALTREMLYACGFHLHKRQWRRRHVCSGEH
jgi:hypothetical protein